MTWLRPHAPAGTRCEFCRSPSTHTLLVLDEHYEPAGWRLLIACCRYHAGHVVQDRGECT